MDILGPDRGKMTIYGSDFQQVNLNPNGGVSPTVYVIIFWLLIRVQMNNNDDMRL